MRRGLFGLRILEHRLNRGVSAGRKALEVLDVEQLRTKYLRSVIPSASEESLFDFCSCKKQGEILRFARNDSVLQLPVGDLRRRSAAIIDSSVGQILRDLGDRLAYRFEVLLGVAIDACREFAGSLRGFFLQDWTISLPVDSRSVSLSRAAASKPCESFSSASPALAAITAPFFSRSSCDFARIIGAERQLILEPRKDGVGLLPQSHFGALQFLERIFRLREHRTICSRRRATKRSTASTREASMLRCTRSMALAAMPSSRWLISFP